MRVCWLLHIVVWGTLTGWGTAWGQTVQQPVVGTFSTSSTVLVPDRGTAFLGGVGSAAASRSTAGPIRTGSTLGRQHQASGVFTSVSIHDLRAMDEALLLMGAAETSVATDSPQARLMARNRGPATMPQLASPVSADSFSPRPVDRAVEAKRFEELARMAAAKGKDTVAKLHWRMAAKYGSPAAAAMLVGDAGRR